jgi:hypothetical protein
MINPMAQAWLDARDDLGIRVVHPFELVTNSGRKVQTLGVYLPDFGCPAGTLLSCRFDPEWIDDLLDDTYYYSSGLNPNAYEPYNRELYIQTLSDWGWYGANDQIPLWYDQAWRDKL